MAQNQSMNQNQSYLTEGPMENPNMTKLDLEAETRVRNTQTPQQAVTQQAPISRSSTTPKVTETVKETVVQDQYPERMKQSTGQTTDQKIYTAESPEVQAEMAKYPGLSIDAAIGNVTMRRDRVLKGQTPVAIKNGIVDSEYAKQEQQRMMKEIEAEKERIDTAPDYLADFYAKEEAKISEKDANQYLSNPELQKIDQEYADYIAQLEGMRGKMEERNQQTVDEIRRVYTDLREQQKVANANRLKAQEIIGTRSGRQRYAPVIQEGVLSAEEKAGLKRISDLQREEESLVNQAIAAWQEQDFALVQSIFQTKVQLRKDKNEEIDRVHKMAMEKEQLSITKMQREKMERDQTLEQLSQISIMGPGTLSEEDASFLDDYLNMPQGFSQAYIDFNVNSKAAQTAKEQFDAAQSYIDMVMKIPEGESITIPGYGTVTGMKEIDPTKGIMSFTEENADGSKFQNYIKYNPSTGGFDIIDSFQTKYPEIKDLDTTTQKSIMLAALGGLDMPVADKKNANEMISSMIEDGNIEGAKEQLKSYIFNSATSTQQEKLEGKEDTVYALKTIQSMIDEYESKGGDLNVFTGLSEKALQKGGFTKDPKLAELANTIGLAIIDYRRAVSGAAFTESEAKAYDALFPSIGKTAELNKAKINSLVNKLESDTENFYRRRVGESKYDEIFGTKDTAGSLSPITTNYMNIDYLLRDNPEYSDVATEIGKMLIQNDSTLTNDPDKLDALVLEQIYDLQGFNQSLNKDSKGSYIPISKSKINSLTNGETKLSIGSGIITGIEGSKYWKDGLDFVISGGMGAPVKVPMSGVVVDVKSGYSNPNGMTPLPYEEGKKQNGGFGNQVKVKFANGVEMWFSHLKDVGARVGQRIAAGSVIGTQGNTGSTYGKTGVHVDITGIKPDGTRFKAREVAALLGDKRLLT